MPRSSLYTTFLLVALAIAGGLARQAQCAEPPLDGRVEAMFVSNGIEVTAIGCWPIGPAPPLTFWAKSPHPALRLRPVSAPPESGGSISVTFRNVNADAMVLSASLEGDRLDRPDARTVQAHLRVASERLVSLRPKTESDRFKFLVCGDTHIKAPDPATKLLNGVLQILPLQIPTRSWTSPNVQILDRISETANRNNVALAVLCGDATGEGRRENYEAFLSYLPSLRAPLFLAMGNHDCTPHRTRPTDRSEFTLRFGVLDYSFNYATAHFILIDNSGYQFDASRRAWLEQEIKSNKRPLTFVFMHVPCWGHPAGTSPADAEPVERIMMHEPDARAMLSIFDRYRPTMVFAGHVHGYFKTMRNGIPYIVTGGGGGRLVKRSGYHNCILVEVVGTQAYEIPIMIAK